MSQQPAPDLTFTFVCGASSIEPVLIDRLEMLGLQLDQSSETMLLFDYPFGFAFRTLPMLTHPRAQVIVLTENLSPEYLEDLWELGPAGLVAGSGLDQTLLDALRVVGVGERYRRTRADISRLTSYERKVVRLLACGWSDERIARELGLADSDARSIAARVEQKLDLDNRVQLAMYYWGIASFCD